MSLPLERPCDRLVLSEREKKAAQSALVMHRALVDFDLTGLETAVQKVHDGARKRGWPDPQQAFAMEANLVRAVRLARKEIGQ